MIITLLGNIGMFGETIPINRVPFFILSDVHTGIGIDSRIETAMGLSSGAVNELLVESTIKNSLALKSKVTLNF
jgi:hypothetical protein